MKVIRYSTGFGSDLGFPMKKTGHMMKVSTNNRQQCRQVSLDRGKFGQKKRDSHSHPVPVSLIMRNYFNPLTNFVNLDLLLAALFL